MAYPKGKDHYAWQENPSYQAIHTWLKMTYGKAKKCENMICKVKKPKRYEYALKKGTKYERKRENFYELCKSCHRIYDKTVEHEKKRGQSISRALKGRKITWGNKISAKMKGRKLSEERRKQMSESARLWHAKRKGIC